ncbi:DUF397 domain-containing protein [Streptomyces sp. WAC01526]|uniref:DUF397 domain-containing protein n=1 Tax=unclassified Streptomyces TaxID=2593676 RepID=UPI0011DF0C93|nr:DUF397 domain-containing protein [Streptomyces sp. WAC01526]
MNTNPRTEPVWRKSSYSSGGGNCVEIASVGSGTVAVRDSKNPAPIVHFSSTIFATFLRLLNSSS